MDRPETKEAVDIVCKELARFLKIKNENYGDSALSPINIFSKIKSSDALAVRMDDKINRIINADELRKNDIVDLAGYLILYIISRGWLDLSDLID